MSDIYKEREQSFETEFALKEEHRFKIAARCNHLLGLWAATRMGLSGALAEELAQEVVIADLEEPGCEDVLRKVMGAFASRGVAIDEKEVRAEMERCHAIATRELDEELSNS